jgi:hypothetical protein
VRWRAGLAAGALLCGVAGRGWADPQSLEEGEPIQLEDAWTDPPGQLSLQFSGQLQKRRGPDADQVLEAGPTIKLGALQGVQLSVNPNYERGFGPDGHQGTALFDALVQLTKKDPVWPTFSADVFYGVPYGAGQKTAIWVFRGIASKELGGEDAPRLHVNFTDYHLTIPGEERRKDQLQFTFGGSVQVGEANGLVADVVRQEAEEPGGGSETLLEVGYNRDLPDDWTFTLGVGRQVEGRGSAWRVLFSFEKELHLWGKGGD